MRIVCRLRAAVTLLLLSTAVFATYAISNAQESQTPDVVIWIDARTPGANGISITYPSVVKRSKAENHLALLLQETGWTASNINITDTSLSESGENPMTSVEFTVVQSVQYDKGILPIEPFVRAFRDMKTIVLVYMLPEGFRFGGYENFENEYVKIVLRRGTNTYEYTISVKKADFDSLGLPEVGLKQATEPDAGASKVGTLATVLVLVLALLAAALVYMLTSRAIHRATSDRN